MEVKNSATQSGRIVSKQWTPSSSGANLGARFLRRSSVGCGAEELTPLPTVRSSILAADCCLSVVVVVEHNGGDKEEQILRPTENSKGVKIHIDISDWIWWSDNNRDIEVIFAVASCFENSWREWWGWIIFIRVTEGDFGKVWNSKGSF